MNTAIIEVEGETFPWFLEDEVGTVLESGVEDTMIKAIAVFPSGTMIKLRKA